MYRGPPGCQAPEEMDQAQSVPSWSSQGRVRDGHSNVVNTDTEMGIMGTQKGTQFRGSKNQDRLPGRGDIRISHQELCRWWDGNGGKSMPGCCATPSLAGGILNSSQPLCRTWATRGWMLEGQGFHKCWDPSIKEKSRPHGLVTGPS